MIFTIIIAFISLIVLVSLHEFGHFIVAKKFGVRVEEFGIGYPPRLFGKKFGGTLYSLNLLPFGAFVKIQGEEGGIEDYHSFIGKPFWQRVLIVLAGVIAFWVIAIVLFIIVFAIGAEVPVTDEADQGLINPRVKITYVVPGSPAESANLRVGDTISELKFRDERLKIDKVSQVQEFADANKGKEIILTIKRDKDFFDVPLIPRVSPPENEGPVGIGLERMANIIERHAWYQAPIKGIFYCGSLTVKAIGGLVKILGDLILGRGVPPGAEVAGPLGITILLARAFELGLGFFLYFIGIITVCVALFNLFPIPVLDGGKLLFLAIEKIRGKAISPKVEQTITMIFFVLLIGLSIFITIKFDIPRFSEFLKSGS